MGIKDWWYKIKGSPVSDVIKHKHRFVVMDTDTFKEKLSFQLSGINLFVVVGVTIIVLILITTVLIAFTPMREWIPGYTNTRAVEQTYANVKRLDSLQEQLENQEWMVATLQAILRGEQIGNAQDQDSGSTLQVQTAIYRRSVEDSLLRQEVEQEDNRYQVKKSQSIQADGHGNVQQTIARIFFAPIKGEVISPYSVEHQGVDIRGDANHPVCAVYGGTIVFSGLTAGKGQMITIQHPGNVVSIYQNCSSLLKRQGDVVRVGEPIAYAGNGSCQEDGTYLHFELWMGGTSVNPNEYISF